MKGKAYTKALRAYLLTDAALHCLLLQTPSEVSPPELSDNACGDEPNYLLKELIDEDDEDDELEPQSPCDTRNSQLTDLQQECNALLADEKTLEDMTSSRSLCKLHDELSQLKEIQRQTRTGRLWLMFMEIAAIVRLFIRGERTGNSYLQIKASQDMLPYFAAVAHNNYAKCCRLYLQDFEDPCVCLKKRPEEGSFTIHRNEQLVWR